MMIMMMRDVQSEENLTVEVPLKKGTWNPEEDQRLIAYINGYGIWNWNEMPKAAGLLRSGKSCRLRWMNYLRPDIKRGNFSKEEDETILTLHEMLGNRWSAIAAKLPGRTDNDIKNRWHSHLKKRFNNNNNNNYGSQAQPNNQNIYISDKNDVSSLLFSTATPIESNSSESNSMENTPITSSSSELSLSDFSSSSSINLEDIQSFSMEDMHLIQENWLMDIDQVWVQEENMEVQFGMEEDNWAITTNTMGLELDGSAVYSYSYASNIHASENDDLFQYYPLWYN